MALVFSTLRNENESIMELKSVLGVKNLPPGSLALGAEGIKEGYYLLMLAIKTFISLLNRYGFKPFGWYRIMLGGSILLLYVFGIELKML